MMLLGIKGEQKLCFYCVLFSPVLSIETFPPVLLGKGQGEFRK